MTHEQAVGRIRGYHVAMAEENTDRSLGILIAQVTPGWPRDRLFDIRQLDREEAHARMTAAYRGDR